MPRIPSEGARTREMRLVGGAKETFLLVRGLDISAFNLSEAEIDKAREVIELLKKEKMTSDQIAERMWAYREKLIKTLKTAVELDEKAPREEKQGIKLRERRERILNDPQLRITAARYQILSADTEIASKAGARLRVWPSGSSSRASVRLELGLGLGWWG